MRGMYIRLSQGNVDTSRLNDYVAYVRTALPILSRQPGFRNAYHAVDRENSRSVIITAWDTEEQAAYEAPPEGVAHLESLGLRPEPIIVLEVTDQV